MIRNSCGSNCHPDPLTFAQMYRLLSVYSLVQPPRGSNISGGEILQTLISQKEVNDIEQELKSSFLSKVDKIVDGEINLDQINELSKGTDHNYLDVQTCDFVKSYVSGYVARRSRKFTTCEACLETLLNVTADPCPEQDLLITLKSQRGLLHPSNQMFRLCSVLEDAVTKVLSSENINNTLFEVVDLLEEIEIPKVGCKADEHVLTVSIVKFYLIMRMHFACTRFNEINQKNREKTKILRKQSRLL